MPRLIYASRHYDIYERTPAYLIDARPGVFASAGLAVGFTIKPDTMRAWRARRYAVFIHNIFPEMRYSRYTELVDASWLKP